MFVENLIWVFSVISSHNSSPLRPPGIIIQISKLLCILVMLELDMIQFNNMFMDRITLSRPDHDEHLIDFV